MLGAGAVVRRGPPACGSVEVAGGVALPMGLAGPLGLGWGARSSWTPGRRPRVEGSGVRRHGGRGVCSAPGTRGFGRRVRWLGG